METTILLRSENIILTTCSIGLWHEFYRNYAIDPMMDLTPYTYNYERIEKAYYSKATEATRMYFAIINKGKVVGNIYLKHINKYTKTTEFGIALINDSVKGKGYGTEAIKLLIDYSFNTLNIETIFADSVLRNTRSQHVLEKVGFVYTHEDSNFKYYKLEKCCN